jgi:hypothetical protein
MGKGQCPSKIAIRKSSKEKLKGFLSDQDLNYGPPRTKYRDHLKTGLLNTETI